MASATANGIELEYDERGTGTPIVLIMGLGAQMTLWRDEFCDQLAAAGHRVIRFDNRDIGLSSKMKDLGKPNVRRQMLPAFLGLKADIPYRLEDMADDTVGLLDALGIEKAHIVGASMGGMIAQCVAIRAPERVLSLTSIMSTTGRWYHGLFDPRVLKFLLKRVEKGKEAVVEHGVATFRAISGTGFPFEEDEWRQMMSENFDRSFHPAGFARQFMAVIAAKDRVPHLKKLCLPALVLHGTQDRLVFPLGGKATAKAIPGAKLRLIEGMGHALPRAAWPQITSAITSHAGNADERPS